MKFPKGKPILENTKLGFVNLDRVLNAAKLERSYKISGYISIIYPEMVDMLLLKAGEPFNAISFSHGKRSLVSISDTIQKAKKAEFGMVNFYEVPEELVNFILISATQKPIFYAEGINGFRKIISNQASIITKFREIKFNGFIEVVEDIEHHYFRISEGKIIRDFISRNMNKVKSWEELIQYIETVTSSGKSNLKFLGFQYASDSTTTQATPAQINLFFNAIHNTLIKFSESLGPTIVAETAESSYQRVKEEFDFMGSTGFENLNLSGNITTSPDNLVKAFSSWFELIKTSFAMIIGEENTIEIIQQAIKEYRFALKSIGFFEKSSLEFSE